MWFHLHKYSLPRSSPMFSVCPPTIEKMYSHQQVPQIISKQWTIWDFKFMFPSLKLFKILVSFDVSGICLHDFAQKPTKSIFPKQERKYEKLSPFRRRRASVSFLQASNFWNKRNWRSQVGKNLHISKIGEIQNNKSVRIFILLI